MTQLNPSISTFEKYHLMLIGFVDSGKPCYSVRDQKEYTSWLEGETIFMSGEERVQDSVYPKKTLREVFDHIKHEPNITTITLAPYVGRHRSPLLALMLASKVIIKL